MSETSDDDFILPPIRGSTPAKDPLFNSIQTCPSTYRTIYHRHDGDEDGHEPANLDAFTAYIQRCQDGESHPFPQEPLIGWTTKARAKDAPDESAEFHELLEKIKSGEHAIAKRWDLNLSDCPRPFLLEFQG